LAVDRNQRVREEYQAAGTQFENDYTRQDAAILNILRACEQAIDLANYMVKKKQLGLPQSSRDSFELLLRDGIIDAQLEQKMKAMIGFRNVAVHNYSNLDIKIVIAIIDKHLDDFILFTKSILSASQ
jgi:uncharacterized protein YutE (UPF0331/DUF86 family)